MHANSYFLRATRTNFKQFDIVDEYDDLDTYNGDAVHDMWVDSDNYENTGSPNIFDEDNIDDYIDNLND